MSMYTCRIKLVLYIINGLPHIKNYMAIQRMCKSLEIDFEETSSYERIKLNNYDILMSCHDYVNPADIPTNIKIIMGPQFFVFPEGPIVGELNSEFSERCVYNILSPWIKSVFLEFVDSFIIPMKELPYSVDTDTFKPSLPPLEKEYDCILYIKLRSNDIVNYTISLLNQKGLKYKAFIYGSYNEEEYMNSLQKTKFMLSLDRHESQGFALEEAMSSGVPLLVMDVTSMYDETNDGINPLYEYLRSKKLGATSVPYWSDECGIKITEQSDLSDAIDRMLNTYDSFTPREYIVRTLSDEVCMRRILDYFNFKSTNINRNIMSAEWDNFTYFTNDNEFIINIKNGTSEPYYGGHTNSQLNIVKRYISKYPLRNRVMIDVGAHIGTTMLPYSRLFSRVYGFEPNKESFDLCLKNIEYNNVTNCSVENCAVLNKKIVGGPVQHNTCNSGCFYFKEDTTGIAGIPSKILDEDDRLINVDFIKIDTEGAEYYVILGALDIIKKYKPLIQAEMNGLCEQNFGIPLFLVIDLLKSLGYQNIIGTDFFCHNEYVFN